MRKKHSPIFLIFSAQFSSFLTTFPHFHQYFLIFSLLSSFFWVFSSFFSLFSSFLSSFPQCFPHFFVESFFPLNFPQFPQKYFPIFNFFPRIQILGSNTFCNSVLLKMAGFFFWSTKAWSVSLQLNHWKHRA